MQDSQPAQKSVLDSVKGIDRILQKFLTWSVENPKLSFMILGFVIGTSFPTPSFQSFVVHGVAGALAFRGGLDLISDFRKKRKQEGASPEA